MCKLIRRFKYEVLMHQLSLRPMDAQQRDFLLNLASRLSPTAC
jgi:hypothetical protein